MKRPVKRPRAKSADKMTDVPLVIRLPAELLQRIDDLVPLVAADAETAAIMGSVTRSSVARLVVVEGVRVVEKRYRQD